MLAPASRGLKRPDPHIRRLTYVIDQLGCLWTRALAKNPDEYTSKLAEFSSEGTVDG